MPKIHEALRDRHRRLEKKFFLNKTRTVYIEEEKNISYNIS